MATQGQVAMLGQLMDSWTVVPSPQVAAPDRISAWVFLASAAAAAWLGSRARRLTPAPSWCVHVAVPTRQHPRLLIGLYPRCMGGQGLSPLGAPASPRKPIRVLAPACLWVSNSVAEMEPENVHF